MPSSSDILSFSINTRDLDRAIKKLDPKFFKRARNRALKAGVEHLLDVVVDDSRVLTGQYKAAWRIRFAGQTALGLINRTSYANRPTGKSMRPRNVRGGEAFMDKVRREQTARVRQIMIEVFEQEYS